jgi:type III secretion system (T3SS) inner membrane Yop/YscD-like protein
MLRLLATHGHEEEVFAIPEGEARLGSAADNEIVLRVTGVSRRHATLHRCARGVEVVDRGSKNGLLVEGRRVNYAVLTPGLRVQVGAAWLEVEEISSTEEALALLAHGSSAHLGSPQLPPPSTKTAQPESDPRRLSVAEAALVLARHIAQRGVGVPGRRADLLARIKATLGAESLVSFERSPGGVLHLLESEGDLAAREKRCLVQLAGKGRPADRQQVVVRRAGPLLVAGRDSWFLGVKFAAEPLAREGWRKELLRFLAHRFFLPVRSLEDLEILEAERVRTLVRGNKRRTAALLDISPGKLYSLLGRRGSSRRSR